MPDASTRLRQSRRTLRARLAPYYAGLFFAAGVVLLAFADAPALTVSHTRPGPGAVVSTQSAQPAGNLHQVLAYSGAALGVMAVLSVVLGWLVAGRVLRPLRVITASAQAISASSLHERLGLDSPYDEFTELGETLDGLFARLEASFESQRHFVANASHELRTPLTAERTLLQVALADPDATVETLRATCQQLLELGKQQERLIEALLTLASGERGIDRWEPFDLAGVAGDVAAERRQEAERRDIRVDAAFSAAATTGDPSLARSLVANLVDNAIRHNMPGGWIKISTAPVAGAAAISVSNTGPVIPPAEVGRLFQPFQRLRAERTRHVGGHGLGLAIVYAIATAHGAVLTAQARPEGGLDVEVRFRLGLEHEDTVAGIIEPRCTSKTGMARGQASSFAIISFQAGPRRATLTARRGHSLGPWARRLETSSAPNATARAPKTSGSLSSSGDGRPACGGPSLPLAPASASST